MIKTFTQADLIRYLYHETTEKEEREINRALITDTHLREQYNSMCALKREMDIAQLDPSAETVQNILHYSGSTSAVKH
jgi:hypothetical protein